MSCFTPGFSILHSIPEFAKIYVLWVSDAVKPSHSLLPPSPPSLNLSWIQCKIGFPSQGCFLLSWTSPLISQLVSASCMGLAISLHFCFCFLFPLLRKMKLLSCVQLFVTPWTVAHEVFLSIGCSREEYWNGLPFPSLGDLPTQGLNSGLPHCRQTLYHLSHQKSHPLLISILNSSKTLFLFFFQAKLLFPPGLCTVSILLAFHMVCVVSACVSHSTEYGFTSSPTGSG